MSRCALWAALLLLPLAACRKSGAITDPEDLCHEEEDGAFGSLTVCASGEVPNVYRVAWEAGEGTAWIDYGLDDAETRDVARLTQSTPASNGGEIAILGMKANHSYAFQPVHLGTDGVEVRGDVHLVTTPAPPQYLPQFTISDYDPSATFEGEGGVFLLSLIQGGESAVVVIDRDGEYLWYRGADGGFSIPSVHPSPNDAAFVYTQNDRFQTSPYGGVVKIAVDGSYRTITHSYNGHHDAIEVPGEDTITFLAAELGSAEVGGETMNIAGDTITETTLGATEDSPVEVVYSLFSNYPYAPWEMCQHFNALAYNTDARDWSHSNSIMMAEDGNYYVMSKNFDALMKVERSTGALMWQIGDSLNNEILDGTHNGDFTFVGGDDDRWSHAHMSHVWGTGTSGGMAVFDNGYHHVDENGDPVARSRATEYAWDEEARTVALVWDYPMPGNGFVPLLGDVRKLGNGNHLVSFTSSAILQEIAGDDTVVWQAVGDVGNGTGRITFLKDLYTLDEEGP